jgi:D-sedoheptulose 7-phosphate isomerase
LNKKKEIDDFFDTSQEIIIKSKSLSSIIEIVSNKIIKCINSNKKVIIFGNGGSAADAQHFAAEFIGRFLKERSSFPAIALTTDTSILTALGNDYGFEKIFSRQCESLVKPGDIVIGISTSGNSSNVINGIKTAKKLGALTVSLTGKTGGKLKNFSDITIMSPSDETPHIQESQRVIIHIICYLVEKYSKN